MTLPKHSTALAVALLFLLAFGGVGLGCGGRDRAHELSRQRTGGQPAREAREAQQLLERRARARRRRERETRLAEERLQRATPQATAPASPPAPASSGGGTPSVDSPEGQRLLKQDPQCREVPPPPPGYHGPVQC
jgi:hypothetical protein